MRHNIGRYLKTSIWGLFWQWIDTKSAEPGRPFSSYFPGGSELTQVITTVSAILASVQVAHCAGYRLPIPLGVSIIAIIVPLANFIIQPLIEFKTRGYSEDYVANAVKILHVYSPWISWAVDILCNWTSLYGRSNCDNVRSTTQSALWLRRTMETNVPPKIIEHQTNWTIGNSSLSKLT